MPPPNTWNILLTLTYMLANTPSTPYYVVIFTSIRTDIEEGYEEMAQEMVRLAALQPGYLGHESI